jgi:hypothetical protein
MPRAAPKCLPDHVWYYLLVIASYRTLSARMPAGIIPSLLQPERIQAVTSLLESARGAVRIEDILPLFPDFVEIDAFKDAICR